MRPQHPGLLSWLKSHKDKFLMVGNKTLMTKFRNILNSENKTLFFKYVFISIISYGFVFTSLIILVDVFNTNKTLAFIMVYFINYLFLYAIQLKYLFKTYHQSKKLIRFVCFILFFYLLSNIIYNIGLILNINYLLSTGLTIVILMPFRLVVSKNFVYKN